MGKMSRKPVIGVTLGDVAGIGPEIVCKVGSTGVFEKDVHTVIIADESELKKGIEVSGKSFPYIVADSIDSAVDSDITAVLATDRFDAWGFPYGKASVEAGYNSASKLNKAIDYMVKGYFNSVSFAPNNKLMMKKAGFHLNGAIDLCASFMGYDGLMCEFSVLGDIWTARVTSHIPLMKVTEHLSVEHIVDIIKLLDSTKRKAGYDVPHIAVAALNPHAGEGGTCGSEEIDIISPAIELARLEGINAEGPLPADTMFYNLFRGEYDAAVTMFHDQGQIAMKLNGFDAGTTVMGGLPYPVTTCSHGTAYAIAGKGIANPGAFDSAFSLACRMASNRLKNPCE